MKFALPLLAVFPALAGEYAVLHTGFRIYPERHEVIGNVVRLHTSTGNMDVPAQQIASFELEEYVKPPEPPKPVIQEAAPAEVPPVSDDPRQLIDDAAAK